MKQMFSSVFTRCVVFAFVFLFSINPINAQFINDSLPTAAYPSKPQEYEIGGVRVTGNQFADAGSIMNIAGFRLNSKIKIPGPELPRAMRALWKLKLFTDVQIRKERQVGDVIFLEIAVQERPNLSSYSYSGVKKSNHEDLNGIVSRFMTKGAIVTENNTANAMRGIEKFYQDKGYLDAKVSSSEEKDPKKVNAVKLTFNIAKNKKVKIQAITFDGNTAVSDRKLRKQMDKTKQKNKLFSSSKLLKGEFENDKKKIIAYYNTIGYRDAQITFDTVFREADGDLQIAMKVDEGKKYFFRNITWKGNTIYETKVLNSVLGINKGDIYNNDLLEKRLRFSQDGRDISSLYLDEGYLFFNVDPTETTIVGDSVDLEMRLYEGPQATIDKVTITGNDRTHEEVIRRELRTIPGQKFSRSDIIRSQREIINLGYFNQEKLDINTPVNPQRGTVDIEYKVEEKSSDQLELSAGYGGFGVVGTLGLTFNNFSARNLFNKETWSPLPQGDGQRLSLRAQSNGKFFQSYNLSVTEPWLGGKKPTSLTTALAYTRYATESNGGGFIGLLQGSVSIGTRLKFPDDNFISTTSLDFQQIDINNYAGFFTGVNNGTFNNLSLQQTIARNTISDPIFPKTGSRISLQLTATPPYSLLNNKNYTDLTITQKFKWVESFKWRFNAEWYTPLFDKFVLKTAVKVGSLAFYNAKVGYSPFGRYIFGGDGLANRTASGLTGNELIALRGYTSDVFEGNVDEQGSQTGGTTFAKYTAELRYPISLNPSSTIFITAFTEGGNVWRSLREFKPFDVRRTAGMGLRFFLPMFGTLGFDYGIGFDKPNLQAEGKKGIKDYGRFSIILGFEPD